MKKRRGVIHSKEHWLRSLVKTVVYRIIIIIMDFTVVYLLTKQVEIAFAFMIISNTYTSIVYYIHERIWNRIKWGKQ